MSRLRRDQDAFGQEIAAIVDDPDTMEIIERDDGRIDAYSAAYTLSPLRGWQPIERRALRYVTGRVLDVGTGAGRVALELQKRRHAVVAIDNSPLAIATAKRRGVKDARVIALADVGRRLGTFDSIVMYGNNFGLVGTPRRAHRILRTLAAMTSPNARILAQTIDPYTSKDSAHVAYRARNRRLGRPPGQLRVRARFGTAATPWFDLLLVSPDEMRGIAEDAGWRVKTVLKGGHVYIGVLEKRNG